jgi:hypothetical protein
MSTQVYTPAALIIKTSRVKLRSGSKRSHVSRIKLINCQRSPYGLAAVSVQGNPVSMPSGSASYAAIDTGTTLIAGPNSSIAAIYAQIPGSSPGTGGWEGFYSYRKLLQFII